MERKINWCREIVLLAIVAKLPSCKSCISQWRVLAGLEFTGEKLPEAASKATQSKTVSGWKLAQKRRPNGNTECHKVAAEVPRT